MAVVGGGDVVLEVVQTMCNAEAQEDYSAMADAILAVRGDAGSSKEVIMSLLPRMNARLVHLRKYEAIAKQGDKADVFGLVIAGALQMAVRTPVGDRCLMRVVRPGEYAGHSLLYQQNPIVPCDVVAYPSCDILVYDLAATRSLRSEPLAARLFCMIEDQLSRSLALAWQRGYIISQRTLVDRVIAYLKIRSAETGSRDIWLPGTIDDFADYLACNRAALSRALSKLRNEGKIDLCGRSHIRLLDANGAPVPMGKGMMMPAAEPMTVSV